jgi:acetylornithine deacetylase
MLDDTKALLAELVAFPTVSSASNLAMIAHLAGRLESSGARVEIYLDPEGQKANLFATIGPDTDGGIVLSGHTDVVPTTDQDWASDPFQLREDHGSPPRTGNLRHEGVHSRRGHHGAALCPDRPRPAAALRIHP